MQDRRSGRSANTGAAPARSVLVVEPDRGWREAITAAFAGDAYVTHEAPSNAQARLLAVQVQCSLVAQGLDLPDADGLVLCQYLVRETAAPVIAWSAHDGDAGEAKRLLALRLGADDVLSRPFSMAELLVRSDVALRRVAQRAAVVSWDALEAPAGRLAVANVWLDDRRHRVGVGSGEVALTPTEYRLLRELMHMRGQALSRDALVVALDSAGGTGGQTLDMHMRHLRAKLVAVAARQHVTWPGISTVRGVGYRLNETLEAGESGAPSAPVIQEGALPTAQVLQQRHGS